MFRSFHNKRNFFFFNEKKERENDGTTDNSCWSFFFFPPHSGSSTIRCLPLVLTGLFLVFIMQNFLLHVNKVSISSSNQGAPLPPSFSPTQKRYFKCFCCPLFLPQTHTFCQDYLALLVAIWLHLFCLKKEKRKKIRFSACISNST